MGMLQILSRLPASYSLASGWLVKVQPVCRQTSVVHYRTLVKHRMFSLPFRTISDYAGSGHNPELPEEDNFGTLSDKHSSRTMFWKTSPELQDMRYEEDEDVADHKRYRGRRNTPYWYFLQCKAKIKEGKLAEALELFEVNMLKEERLPPAESNYTVLMGGCGRAGYVKKAFKLYSDMKKRGLVPTDATYTALFNACAESPWKDSGLQHALKLRKELMDKNIQLNPITYRSLLKVCALNSGLQDCFEIFKEMAQKLCVTGPETFNVLFMGCIKDEELGFLYALQLWRQMLHMGVKPDINTYNLLIRATRDCGIGDAAEALHLLTQSKDLVPLSLGAGKEEQGRKSHGIKKRKEGRQGSGRQQLLLDSSSSVSGVTGSDGAAMELAGSQELAEMSRDHHFPSVPSFDSSNLPNLLDLSINTDNMVSLANVHTPFDRLALIGDLGGILHKMKEDKVCPTIKTFTLLAEVVKPDVESEATLLDIIGTYGIQPDLTFFNTLVLKRSKTMKLKSALELLPTMAQRGIAPNMHTFCNLARACLKKEEGLQLLEDIMIAGFHPNNNVYSTLINAAIKRLDYDYLINILRDMRSRNVKPNEVVIRQLEFAAQYPPNFDRYLKKNVFLEKIDGFRGYYTRWLEWMDAEETEHPWQKYRTKAQSDSETN
ncbi:pentatricopeptide repeat-containing protein 1, mitochondrial [Bufo bufo]|uniref:pentatricopeptide repeat-containing protein 1, mitochondrial n=1 Tax=Bufo bufo TaxID=8384 RepID=UPI001ABDE047|nr:pentatricopeptide repeat-containing protein 1, mitochondrial [Bufo bufo]XP_040295370.1 pentatricopeptide repeat-containing protein 1, mitochondrial [Bufo bufo]XP_040295371.1 pentatricopeptide repeat-containing protein 1, mitochondrial [Bufo bufo]XP_040295372.1 pentatricopeptide repeat-containing protein 1, mitochondrial [Bufo bufo]